MKKKGRKIKFAGISNSKKATIKAIKIGIHNQL